MWAEGEWRHCTQPRPWRPDLRRLRSAGRTTRCTASAGVLDDESEVAEVGLRGRAGPACLKHSSFAGVAPVPRSPPTHECILLLTSARAVVALTPYAKMSMRWPCLRACRFSLDTQPASTLAALPPTSRSRGRAGQALSQALRVFWDFPRRRSLWTRVFPKSEKPVHFLAQCARCALSS